MTEIKKGDFIELSYTGKVDTEVFDSTEQLSQKSVVVCIGQGHILRGLDASLEGKKIGQEFSITIQPENGFGRKDAHLIQMIPKAKFTEQKIDPHVGMQLNIDQQMAVVRQVSGGRILVDFNHPLAGRELEYTVKPLRRIEDKQEQLKYLLSMELGLPETEFSTKVAGETVTIEFPEPLNVMLDQVQTQLTDRITTTIGFKKIEITYRKIEEKKPHQEEQKTTPEQHDHHTHVKGEHHGHHH